MRIVLTAFLIVIFFSGAAVACPDMSSPEYRAASQRFETIFNILLALSIGLSVFVSRWFWFMFAAALFAPAWAALETICWFDVSVMVSHNQIAFMFILKTTIVSASIWLVMCRVQSVQPFDRFRMKLDGAKRRVAAAVSYVMCRA